VRNINLGSQPVGLVNWQWDGRNDAGNAVADGAYTFKVSATQAGKGCGCNGVAVRHGEQCHAGHGRG